MTKNGAKLTHAKQHSSRENASNMDTKEIKQINQIKLEILFEKESEYGTNHFFQVSDITHLQELVEVGKTMEILIWEYNGKFLLKINAVKVETQIENGFKKHVLYIMGSSFSKYDFQKGGGQFTGYSISEINKNN